MCEVSLNEGDKVVVSIKATYHLLKSSVTYALDKSDMEAVPDTLAHWNCTNFDEKD